MSNFQFYPRTTFKPRFAQLNSKRLQKHEKKHSETRQIKEQNINPPTHSKTTSKAPMDSSFLLVTKYQNQYKSNDGKWNSAKTNIERRVKSKSTDKLESTGRPIKSKTLYLRKNFSLQKGVNRRDRGLNLSNIILIHKESYKMRGWQYNMEESSEFA